MRKRKREDVRGARGRAREHKLSTPRWLSSSLDSSGLRTSLGMCKRAARSISVNATGVLGRVYHKDNGASDRKEAHEVSSSAKPARGQTGITGGTGTISDSINFG